MGSNTRFKNMVSRRAFMMACVTALCCGGLAALLYTHEGADTSPAVPLSSPMPTQAVQAADFADIWVEPGFLISDERVVLKTRMSGFIEQILIREGQHVRRGETLVLMDASSVEAAIAQQRAQVERCRIELRDAERDIAHYGPMAEQGAYPREKVYKLHIRRKSALAALEQAQAALNVSLADNAYVGIVSPLDGVVLTKHKNAGDMAVPGEALLTLDSGQKMVFRFHLPEHRLNDISPDSPVTLTFASLPDTPVTGRIRSIIPTVDTASRRFEVNVDVPPTAGLVPGMYGRAAVTLGSRSVLAVPETALVERGGLRGVLAADQEERMGFRWLRLGRTQGGLVEVHAGLQAGERIAVPVANARHANDTKTGQRSQSHDAQHN